MAHTARHAVFAAALAACSIIPLATPSAQASIRHEVAGKASGMFTDPQSCHIELRRRTQIAELNWRYSVVTYLQRLSVNPEPRDDTERAMLWIHYQRAKKARMQFDQYRTQAFCDAR